MISRSHTVTSLVICLMIGVGIGSAQSPPNLAVLPQAPATYVLGPGDQVMVQLTPGGEEVNGKLWRIDEAGDLIVPIAGTAHAAGLTTHRLADVLTERYKVYFRAPQV